MQKHLLRLLQYMKRTASSCSEVCHFYLPSLQHALEVIKRSRPCVCLCGFVSPTLCTMSTVQDYPVHCLPALCIVHRILRMRILHIHMFKIIKDLGHFPYQSAQGKSLPLACEITAHILLLH